MLAIQRFTVTGAIDASFRIYHDHFKALFLVSLVIGVPNTLATLGFDLFMHKVRTNALSADALSAGNEAALVAMLAGLAVFFVVVMLVALVCGTFGMAAATRIASMAALDQRPVLKDGLDQALRVFWSLLGASLLVGFAAFTGLIFLIVPGIIVYLGCAFIAPVVVLEGRTASDALGRSWQLTKGRRWKILGTLLLFTFMVGTVTGGIAMVGAIINLTGESLTVQVVQTLLTQAVSVLATPIWYVSAVLLYYDARVEHEAFDVSMLAQSAAAGASSTI